MSEPPLWRGLPIWHGQSPQQLWDRDAVSDLIDQAVAAERERVREVIARVRAERHGDPPDYGDGWDAACDAIEAALGEK